MANNDVIQVRGLKVVRGGRVVLPDLTVDVRAGCVTGLLGPSGSGKSTFIRSVVGVQVVASGTVEVLGRPAGAADLRTRVGYVTQEPSVYADLTVRENLSYFAAVLGAPRTDVGRVLHEVALESHASALAGRLSGGQLSRVSLAAALLGAPELLVLDEPTVGLDPVLRRDIWDQFHRLAGQGVGVLVSSHVMDEASRCDRLLLLRDGRMLADDEPAALLARTGGSELEAAFLRLCDQAEVAA